MYHKFFFIKNALRKYLKKKYETFPKLLSIEITSACNAKCIMCPRDSLTRPIQHMSEEIFNKIISDCKGNDVKKINLFWFGDPLCNPNIKEYLSHIKRELPKVKLYISTNAELLNESLTNEILEKELIDVINFDIDGTTKDTYESVRVGVNFDKVLENVHYFIEKKKELNARKPQTRLTMIKMDKTADEVEDFKKYWSSRADKVDISNYNTWLGTKEDRNVGDTLEKSQRGSFKYPCVHPWEELVISADGIAGLCCLDYDLSAKVGNVMKNSIKDIWQGEVINGFRQKMIDLDYDKIEACRKCNAYIYQDGKLWSNLWI